LRVPEKLHEVRMKSKGEQVNPSKGAKNGNALGNGNRASVQAKQKRKVVIMPVMAS
jgi:hypothetical protein